MAVGDVAANVETPDAGPEADAARQEARATPRLAVRVETVPVRRYVIVALVVLIRKKSAQGTPSHRLHADRIHPRHRIENLTMLRIVFSSGGGPGARTPLDRTLAGAALFRPSRASGDFQSHANLLAFSQQLFRGDARPRTTAR